MQPQVEWVPVPGGRLAVHRLNDAAPDAPVLVALHSISSNALAWQPVADALAGEVLVLAPDLRGRAESSGLRSRGIADHVDDALRAADHLGVERLLLAGHSMGAFAAALAAATHPERVEGVVLVDGGIAFPSPNPLDVDAVLHQIVGPAMDRLTMTFADPAAYLDYWRAHPAIGPLLDGPSGSYLVAYLLHDLTGPPGEMRSSSSLAGVRADWADMMSDPATLSAVHALQCPAHLLWAARGPLGEPGGLYTEERIAQAHLPADIRVTRLEADHYGALLLPGPVRTAADAVRALARPAGLAGLPPPLPAVRHGSGPDDGREIHIPVR